MGGPLGSAYPFFGWAGPNPPFFSEGSWMLTDLFTPTFVRTHPIQQKRKGDPFSSVWPVVIGWQSVYIRQPIEENGSRLLAYAERPQTCPPAAHAS